MQKEKKDYYASRYKFASTDSWERHVAENFK